MTLNRFNLKNKIYYKQIIKHAKEFPNEEVCGIVYLNKILVVDVSREVNESEDRKNSFRISAKKISGRTDILGIYHSHPKGGPEPSPSDIENSEEMGIPFLIYSNQNNTFYLYFPKTFKPRPLTGRPYVTGFHECTRIFFDQLSQERPELRSIFAEINHWPPDSSEVDVTEYVYCLFDGIFDVIEKNQIKKNDMLILDNSDVVPHVALYEGDGMIVHQTAYHLSHREEFSEKWQRRLLRVYRSPSLV